VKETLEEMMVGKRSEKGIGKAREKSNETWRETEGRL
jgi:hypothetical protein